MCSNFSPPSAPGCGSRLVEAPRAASFTVIPAGPVSAPVKGNPDGEYFFRIEQPRGEAIYYVKCNGTKNLERFRLRTPTTSNIPPMVQLLKGSQLADVPLLILTIDPCVSCTER